MRPTRFRQAFVLGSGIAGLSLAEILTRNGWRVTLVEASRHLGGDASRATQNWLHTGWLYAALRNPSAMHGCHRALNLFHSIYGKVLGQELLNLHLHESGVSYPRSRGGWFSPEPVYYLYALKTSELTGWQRVFWPSYLSHVALRRLRELGYPTTPSERISGELRRLLNHWEGSPDGSSKYAVIRSTDSQINTRRVMNSLISLLGENTEVIRGAQYELASRNGRSTIILDGKEHTPDLLVVATGKCIPQQLRELGKEDLAARFKSISSPIVVLNRELSLPSFIRFTPQVQTTVNHIKYTVDGVGPVSTVGSYEYYPAGNEPDISPFVDRVCARLNVPKADVLDTYYGTKTEFVGSAERRYNHAVEQINENSFFAIPGKFSQFPLLVHEFAEQLGLRTDIANQTRGRLLDWAAPTFPEQIAQELARPLQPEILSHAL